MARYKSPGQKRKGTIRILSVILFLSATFAASQILDHLHKRSLEWTTNHQEVTATITEMTQESQEYRNLKGRTRTKEVYNMSYDFDVAGKVHSNTTEVSYSEYSGHKKGDSVTIWYAANNPDLNDTKSNMDYAISHNDTTGNMISSLPYTIPGSLFLYGILTLLFARESKKVLPEGFYTDASWLDIDDNYIVSIDGGDLVYFNFDAKRASNVQDAYQNGAPLEQLMATSGASKLGRIPFKEISEVRSDHNSDVIHVKHASKNHMVEFLNQTVKAHALERMKAHIPATLAHSRTHKSRFQAAMPSLVLLVILGAGIAYFHLLFAQLALGLIALIWIVPKLISRLLDPTVTDKWERPTPGAATQPAT